MDIEILEFIPDRKGMKIGFVDFKVVYSPDKQEIFRQVGFFEKDNKKWLSVGSIERDGKWIPRYERKPSMQNMFHEVIAKLEEHISNQSAHSDYNPEMF